MARRPSFSISNWAGPLVRAPTLVTDGFQGQEPLRRAVIFDCKYSLVVDWDVGITPRGCETNSTGVLSVEACNAQYSRRVRFGPGEGHSLGRGRALFGVVGRAV